MSHRFFYNCLFVCILFGFKSYGHNRCDSVKIVRSNANYYLHYCSNGISKEILLPYPFVDSSILVDDILLQKNNREEKRSVVNIGNMMIVTAADFDFSNKAIMFIIDKVNNKLIKIGKLDELYIETGFPYFIISDKNILVTSNTFSFIDSSKEENYVHYYKILDNEVKWLKNRKRYFKEKELNNNIFLSNKFINSLLNNPSN